MPRSMWSLASKIADTMKADIDDVLIASLEMSSPPVFFMLSLFIAVLSSLEHVPIDCLFSPSFIELVFPFTQPMVISAVFLEIVLKSEAKS
jgi:hypothetical protein